MTHHTHRTNFATLCRSSQPMVGLLRLPSPSTSASALLGGDDGADDVVLLGTYGRTDVITYTYMRTCRCFVYVLFCLVYFIV